MIPVVILRFYRFFKETHFVGVSALNDFNKVNHVFRAVKVPCEFFPGDAFGSSD